MLNAGATASGADRLRLIADVGGTNTRIGLSTGGDLRAASLRRYRNSAFPTFDDLLRTYLDEAGSPAPSEAVIAAAGPVQGDRIHLTNRDWVIDTAALRESLGLDRAGLLNDLEALGQSAFRLGPGELSEIVAPRPDIAPGRQALIVGAGTGFNICPAVRTAERVTALRCEFGHTQLSHALAQQLGSDAFETVEDLFSGRGLMRLHNLREPNPAEEPGEIAARAGEGEAGAQRFLESYAALFGHQCRELAIAFPAGAGLFLAGSVARAATDDIGRAAFIRAFTRPFPLEGQSPPAVRVIESDEAALIGCAAFVLD